MLRTNGKVILLNRKHKDLVKNILANSNLERNDTLNHFIENENNCIVRLIPKSILDDFSNRMIIQNRENNTISEGELMVYGELFTNSLWDKFTYNIKSYSPFSKPNQLNGMGHYNFRSTTFLFNLEKSIKFPICPIYSDICIHSYIDISNLSTLSKLIVCDEPYYLVITHGYLLYDSFNKVVETEKYNIFKDVISFDTYKRDYIYRMATPLHIYNTATHIDFLRLSFIGLFGYLLNFDDVLFTVNNKGNSKLMGTLKNEYNSKLGKNQKLFNVQKSLRLLVPDYLYSNKGKKITLDITREGTKVNSVTDFSYPDISKLPELPHDVSENFTRDNLVGLPTISYGLSNILDLILKDYTRSCCDGLSVERAILHLDLNDLLDVCNPIMNAEVNHLFDIDGFSNSFYNDWKCLYLLDIIEKLCDGSPISFEQLKSDFSKITENIENKLNDISIDEQYKYKSIPYLLLLCFVLYRFTGRLSSVYKEKLLKYHPNVEVSTNGVVNYYPVINKFLDSGVVELQNKCPSNVCKMEKEYDFSDMVGFSLSGSDIIHHFEEDSENLIIKDEIKKDSFDIQGLEDFGKIDFSESVERAKSLTYSDFDFYFGDIEGSLEIDDVNDNPLSPFVEDDGNVEDIPPSELNGLFGTDVDLDLSFMGLPTNEKSIESESKVVKQIESSFSNGLDNPTLSMSAISGKNSLRIPDIDKNEFDKGIDDYFKTSPFFDKNLELKEIVLQDIFNSGLDYSVAQIKSLIVQDGISIDVFRKELLKRILNKINSDDDIFDVYTAFKKLF